MSRLRRPELVAEAARINQEQLGRAGGELRASRKRRRLTQRHLGEAIGVSQSTISRMERGRGAMLSIEVWQRAFVAVERKLMIEAARDLAAAPLDAGHLQIQELVLRLGRPAGYTGLFELATRPSDPSRSADVGLRDDVRRRLVLVECWNTISDIGAGARTTARKIAEAQALAIALGGERPHTVFGCWVVRATRRNRELLATYPEVFAARFPGSSTAWVAALTTGSAPPTGPGLVWCDVDATRLFAWRRRG